MAVADYVSHQKQRDRKFPAFSCPKCPENSINLDEFWALMRGLEDYQVSDGTVDVQHGDSRVGNADAGRDHVGKDGDASRWDK